MLLLSACDAAPSGREAASPATSADLADTDANCVIPADITPPRRATPPDDRPDAPASGYVMALSWSPEFCRFRADQDAHAGQCRDNRFGFILHGLWPQAARGPHPRACALAAPVSEDTIRRHYCMTPSAALIQHEWAAHGTCAWDSADAYFADAARLWDRVDRPDLFALSRKEGLVAADIRAAFVAVNPGLPAEAVGVDLDNRGWLEEIFICLDLDERPRACAPREYGAHDNRKASIWRGGRPKK
ncbi:ribonuclease T [Pacificimonas sp. WHA3]|uniref:Ribonuclease T n=1 Tax=Pacificimonas pallii TaxID=2827236 RepID=A0ABS6SDK8_9SPHN|nr:ribonuclease T [Pacificimonas pallii]MBV7255932.1 ribonuclease T [Pacificimonas pallii]